MEELRNGNEGRGWMDTTKYDVIRQERGEEIVNNRLLVKATMVNLTPGH